MLHILRVGIYIEGQGDLVNGLKKGKTTRVAMWVIQVTKQLAKSP